MLGFMATLGQRRHHLRSFLGKTAINSTVAGSSTVTSMAPTPIAGGDFGLKLTILCLLTTFGASLADHVLIERLLYPARFYNLDPFDGASVVTVMLTTALACLFDPKNQATHKGNPTYGNMLGTAFYPAHYAKYRTRGGVSAVENGFWTRVLELIPYSEVHSKSDYELLESNRLKLRAINHYNNQTANPNKYVVSEKGKDYKKYLYDIAVSEFPAIAFIVFYGTIRKIDANLFAFAILLLCPTMTKVFFAVCAVDRKTFHVLNVESANNADIFETQFGASRLSSIEGEHTLVHRFFEYYGQPIRNVFQKRRLMTYLALLLGPIPLIVAVLVVANKDYAYPFLAHQGLVLFGWFVARLFNLNSCGRTEERIAKALYKGKRVIFVNADGTSAVQATLQTTLVNPKPVPAPTLVSAKPLETVLEESEAE